MSSRRKPSRRPPLTSRMELMFDQMTLAALPAAVLLVLAAVFYVGIADAEVRLGCGLNALVNRILDIEQACR